jgi:hypothetical protein
MVQLNARESFDFVNLDTGLYTFKVKECDIVDAKEEGQEERKVKNDYNYVVQFQVEGGENDGQVHFERFPHVSQNSIGVAKLMMCANKLEVIGPPPHDSEKFDRERFKEKFMMQFPGRKVIGIVKKVASKKTGSEFANIVAFYHVNELKVAQDFFAKTYGPKGPKLATVKETGPLPGAVPAETTKPVPTKGPGKDDW